MARLRLGAPPRLCWFPFRQAARWFSMASDRGGNLATIWLAELRIRGAGGPRNLTDLVRWPRAVRSLVATLYCTALSEIALAPWQATFGDPLNDS